eukprot:541297-Pleurochrysis_carterae.AAC.1
MSCYRAAIKLDERHYNAWYGLGSVYYRQEKYDFAEHHLRKARAAATPPRARVHARACTRGHFDPQASTRGRRGAGKTA